MPVSKAQKKAAEKYVKNNYDEIKTRVPKGRKEIIKEHASKNNESLNSFINRAIEEAIARDKIGGFSSSKRESIKITRFSEIESDDSSSIDTDDIETKLKDINWD